MHPVIEHHCQFHVWRPLHSAAAARLCFCIVCHVMYCSLMVYLLDPRLGVRLLCLLISCMHIGMHTISSIDSCLVPSGPVSRYQQGCRAQPTAGICNGSQRLHAESRCAGAVFAWVCCIRQFSLPVPALHILCVPCAVDWSRHFHVWL